MIAMGTLIRGLVLAGILAAAVSVPLRAEMVDEIVAKVNDDIVTKSDLDTEEQGVVQELYRHYSGGELDRQVADAKKVLLRRLIDQRVLIQRAAHLFDIAKMQDFYVQSFKEQQDIKTDKDLEKMLSAQGMTMADLKTKLVEQFAPRQVVNAEVADRIAVSEKDQKDYYDAHVAEFTTAGQATVREIVVRADDSNRADKRSVAATIRDRAAAAGADFAAVAAEVSDAGTKKNGGLLGTVKKGDLSVALDAAAFSLPVGEVSPVIDADYGFHILKVDSRSDAMVKPFTDVKNEIETKIRSSRMEAEYASYMKKAWGEATIWVSPKYESRLSAPDATN